MTYPRNPDSPGICSEPDCTKSRSQRSTLCRMHRARRYRSGVGVLGRPTPGKMARPGWQEDTGPMLERVCKGYLEREAARNGR